MNIRAVSVAALALAASLAVSLAAIAPTSAASSEAIADMSGVDRGKLGTLQLTQMPTGVLIRGQLEGLMPGVHGFHIHETGNCDPETEFKSAGGHLALGKRHGFLVEGGPHPGDMTNVHVGGNGKLTVEYVNSRVGLDQDNEAYLLDGDGSAIVIHADADDYKSQPSGAAGNRIACGVIRAR